MAKQISDVVNNLLSGVTTITRSETIVGEPQKAGEASVIPVHRLKVAFGAGSGSAGAHGSKLGGDSGAEGAGGAVELDPVAAIAVGKDGHAHLLAVENDTSLWTNLLQEVPDIVTKVAQALGDRVTKELKDRNTPKEIDAEVQDETRELSEAEAEESAAEAKK